MTADGGARTDVTIAIIDDHDVVHAGIEAWCSQASPPMALVAKFRHPRDFFATVDQAKRIDVVFFDPHVDGRFDFAAVQMLCQTEQRVVIFSHFATDETILTSLELGADTYLVKSEGKRHLIEAIHASGIGHTVSGAADGKGSSQRPNVWANQVVRAGEGGLARVVSNGKQRSRRAASPYRIHHCAYPPPTRAGEVRPLGGRPRLRLNRRCWHGRSRTGSSASTKYERLIDAARTATELAIGAGHVGLARRGFRR